LVSKAVASLRDTRRLYAEQSEVGRMWMDSNLEHTVKFTEEVETTSYTWCLRELNKDGNKIGYDQIPWEFDAEFSVADQHPVTGRIVSKVKPQKVRVGRFLPVCLDRFRL
jgi:hypothetical protein